MKTTRSAAAIMNSTLLQRRFHGSNRVTAAAVVFAVAAIAPAFAESRSAGDEKLFDRLDADDDGRLTADEISSEQQPLFARLLRRADTDSDQALSRDEFLAALVPSRPEKPIEEKVPSTFPQAEAVRWLLLTMDTSGNSRINADEVPEKLQPVFEAMLERIDGNKNGALEQRELSRGGRPLAQIAARYTRQNRIDVTRELKKLENRLGPAANRFEEQPVQLDNLGDPARARQAFAQLDSNGNGQIELKEIPEPLQRPLQRMMRTADRDGDDRLSQREFLAAAKRRARRQMPAEAMPAQPR